MSNIQYLFSKLIYTELSEVFNELRNIDYAIIKGEPLSKIAYGEFCMRQSTDIDILIDKCDMRKIQVILEKSGFKQKELNRQEKLITSLYSHQTAPYTKRTDIANLTVDVNYELFWGEYEGDRINIKEFLSETVEMKVFGYTVKTLDISKTFVQIVLHHYKEMNSIYHLMTHNSINIKMFNDIYFLLKSHPELTPNHIYTIAEKYKILPYVYYILYYTALALKKDFLHEFVLICETPKGKELLDFYGLNRTERKPWQCDFKTRLNISNLSGLIAPNLSDDDINKLERSRKIFG